MHCWNIGNIFEIQLLYGASIYLFKCINKAGDDVLRRYLRYQFGEVDHTRLHGRHAMLLQLGGLDLEVALQLLHIGTDKDGTMMQSLILAFGKSIARKLTPLAKHVVATADLRRQPI